MHTALFTQLLTTAFSCLIIRDIDEQQQHNLAYQEVNGGGGNRSTTAASSLNRRSKQQQQHQQPRGQFAGGANWNDMAVGKTPPPMRRSLTVMNNYHDDNDDGVDGGSSSKLDNGSSDINSLLDLKRATVRRKLCSSLSTHVDRENHLNLRPDTAFPRSRGLVPK